MTPDVLPVSEAQIGSEIRDRRTLRKTPPPILVTNATMLEYMLVRTQDSPILEASNGKLEWIILDEAHTYAGFYMHSAYVRKTFVLLRRPRQ
jgi:hypothetical protein